MKQAIAVLGLCVVMAWPTTSRAFCGFYVSGADASLYNNATMVVMMREGTRTVLSMQNNYQGPPEDFAMIVPVPVVLQGRQRQDAAAPRSSRASTSSRRRGWSSTGSRIPVDRWSCTRWPRVQPLRAMREVCGG